MNKISRQSFLKLAAAAAMSGITAGALSACGNSSSVAASSSASSAVAAFTPGTYTGTAKGMSDVTVTMTFSETAITDIQLDVSGETESIGGVAADALKEALMTAQSAEIDNIAGATVTTNAVKEAAASCIEQAMGVVREENSSAAEPTWRTAPEAIADSEISETIETDVAVVGFGYAGLAVTRSAAEEGLNVVAVEAMERDSWWTIGHDLGHINSKILASRGVPKVDEVEFLNNWMLQTHNKANPALVMQYAKNCGDAADWYLGVMDQETLDKAHVMFWPENEYTVHQLNNGLRYYPGTIELWESYWEDCTSKQNNTPGQLEMKDVSWANRDYIEANLPNATILFGTKGVQLVMDGKKVIGFIAQKNDGSYCKILASKGVVLCGGGFGGNREMLKDLLPYVDRMFVEGEDFSAPKDRDGSSIQMGVWAGGRLETEISTMNFDSARTPDSIPGALWVDKNGERFQNEAFAGTEINGFFLARSRRGNITAIYDNTYPVQIMRGFPGHRAFDYSNQMEVDVLTAKFEAARTAGAEGAEGFYCADTIEQLASYIGVDPATLCATVDQYNSICESGVDTDFGKDPRFLNGVKEGPFFAHVTTPSLGSALVTTGGFVTTNNQQVVNADYEPIEGLYASGNTCGLRFGPAYITPISGVSISICLTLGRELGKYLANL